MTNFVSTGEVAENIKISCFMEKIIKGISIKQMEEMLDNGMQQAYEHIHELQTLKQQIHNVVIPRIRPHDYVSLVMYALECHGVDFFSRLGYKKAAEELTKEVG